MDMHFSLPEGISLVLDSMEQMTLGGLYLAEGVP